VSSYIERRDERRRLAGDRRLALAAAASAIRRWVPDLPGLVANLRYGGGSERLIKAIEAVPVVKVPDVVGQPHPDVATWGGAVGRMVGSSQR
jgi:hypothetical protein